MSKTWIEIGAILLTLAVIIGAFGAHGLKSKISPEMLQIYKTGVEYHFYHALGILIIAVIGMHLQSNLIMWSGICMFAGIVLFSGSLYVMAVTGVKWLGAVTPIGGLSFVAGWILLFLAAFKHWK